MFSLISPCSHFQWRMSPEVWCCYRMKLCLYFHSFLSLSFVLLLGMPPHLHAHTFPFLFCCPLMLCCHSIHTPSFHSLFLFSPVFPPSHGCLSTVRAFPISHMVCLHLSCAQASPTPHLLYIPLACHTPASHCHTFSLGTCPLAHVLCSLSLCIISLSHRRPPACAPFLYFIPSHLQHFFSFVCLRCMF